jgi:hypothetical protein
MFIIYMENIVKFNTFDADDDFDKLRVDLDELYERQRVKDELKMETLQKILKRVFMKIKHSAKAVPNRQYMLYQVPTYLVGNPRYDLTECVEYLDKNLNDNGFKTKFIYPNILFISWQHYVPYYQRMQYKMKTGILIDGFGNVISRKNEIIPKKENIFENITQMRKVIEPSKWNPTPQEPPKHVHFDPPKDEIEFSILNDKPTYRDASKTRVNGFF